MLYKMQHKIDIQRQCITISDVSIEVTLEALVDHIVQRPVNTCSSVLKFQLACLHFISYVKSQVVNIVMYQREGKSK